ncbi:hypothetical protein [Sphingobium sp.]|uniref:hypothetical protein n=1 Tax=Sphingobium sp. TaxID=1912891 RepID=UPI0035C784BF
MIYKAFAAITLIAAPIVVMTVQSFVPQTNLSQTNIPQTSPAVPPVSASSTAEPAAAPVQPPVNAPPADAASFGQPMPEAGRPFLTPGTGLPDGATPAAAGPVEEPAPDLNPVAR